MLGRFGIKINKTISGIVSTNTFNYLSTRHLVVSYKIISEDKILVTYDTRLDLNLIKSLDLDFIKILNKYGEKETQTPSATSIAISAAVSAYGRIHISKLKLDILKLGGNIYYSDTHSIVTDNKFSDKFIGKGLGMLKLEHIITKGIFISGKTYCFVTKDGGKIVNKAKGVKSSSLTYED